MGRRGPKPTPTAVLETAGSWRARARRQEPRAEPAPDHWPCDPRISKNKVARKMWNYIGPLLRDLGVLAKVDRYQLTRYCELWSLYCLEMDFLTKHGETYAITVTNQVSDENTRKFGIPVKEFKAFPQATNVLKLDAALRQMEANFGLSPADRTRIATPGPGETDDEAGEATKFFRVTTAG